jgi:hypothetical protein
VLALALVLLLVATIVATSMVFTKVEVELGLVSAINSSWKCILICQQSNPTATEASNVHFASADLVITESNVNDYATEV